MKKYIILTISLVLLFSCTTEKYKAVEHYRKAKDYLNNDNIKQAFEEIDKAIALDSSNLDFLIIKSEIVEKANNYELAIEILEGLSKRKFKLDTVNFMIGSYYFGFGSFHSMKHDDEGKATKSYEKALNYFDNAIKLNTQYFDAYVEKQKTLHNLGRYDEALVLLSTAINLFPDSTLLICSRGVEKIYLGDRQGAMTDLNKAIQSNKLDSLDLSTANRFRGDLYLEMGKYDEAINDLNNAIKYNPKNELAFAERAFIYRKNGLKDKACEDYRKAADLGFVSLYETIKEYCLD